MRVLLIHQAFVSPKEAGGTRHYELGRHLVECGHEFTIVASDLSYLTGERTAAGKGIVSTEVIEGIRVLRAYTYPSLHRGIIWRIITYLSFMVSSVFAGLRSGPVDIVMGTSPPIFQAVSALLVATLRRKPLLLEVRDLWPAFVVDMGLLTNPILIWIARKLEHSLYSRAAHILVNSPAYRDYLIAEGVPAEKVSLIPNGVDTNMFDPDEKAPDLRRELGFGDQFIITYAGALGKANDIGTILRAAQRLQDDPSIQFLLVGDGIERPNLEKICLGMGLSNVMFVGAKPKTEMPRYLAASDACVATLRDIPMFKTTYPRVAFYYMAAGRPTVLAIDGVIRDVVEAAEGGMCVPPGNDAALALAVRALKSSVVEARNMGKSGRAYVEAHFDRSAQAASFVKLVEAMSRE